MLLVALVTCSILHVEGQTYLTSLDQVTSGYYRIYSQYNTNGSDMVISEDVSTHNMYCDNPNVDDYLQIWHIDVLPSSENSKSVTLQNVVTQMNVNRSSGNFHTHANAMTFTLQLDMLGFTFLNGGGGLHHQQSGHDVRSWDIASEASHWQLEEVDIDDAKLTNQRIEYADLNNMISNASTITTALSKYFTDASCSQLNDAYKNYADDVLTTEMISDIIPQLAINMAIKVKNSAWEVYEEGWRYDEKVFRIGTYKPMGSPDRWKNITKVGYAFSPNSDPTAIAVKANDIITVYVSNIPAGGAVSLRNVQRYSGTGDGYSLHNGFNVIKVQAEGLLFMDYEVDNTTNGAAPFTALNSYPEITVHIEGGKVNGSFSLLRGDTNEDWAIMKEKLFKEYDFLQLRSNKQIFNMDASSVIAACPEKMVELLGQWDIIVNMEHDLMGLADFDGYFNNPLMAVSLDPTSSSHMYATNFGTYYNENTLSGVMNYENMFGGSNLWGPAHEIGHINQAMINMIGQSEVSNNLFSNVATFLNGHLTSRAEYTSTTLKNMADGLFWMDRGIWERTHLYYQLYQFFHAQGFMNNFYQELFKAFRADPMDRTKNKFVDATNDYLKFYKKACEVSGYDLTELFQAYGFFVVPELKSVTIGNSTKDVFEVGDYGTFYLYITQQMIDDAISEVKSHNYKKTNIVFIEDRISAPLATYEGHAENELKTAYGGYPIGDCGDVGQYTDFVSSNVATGYLASYVENDGGLNVYVNHSNASGAVGFKVYDAAGNLVYLSNKYNFTVPANVYSKIKNTDFTIVAAGGNGEDAIMPAAAHYVEWIVKNNAGEVVKTYQEPQFVNSVVSDYPDEIKPAFVTLPSFTAFTYTEPVQKVVEAVYTTPFVESSETAYNYYEVKVRYGWLNETSEGKAAITNSKQNTDYYRWAFFGSPYVGYRLQNKATGKWLNAGESAPEMGNDADAATVWKLLAWSGNTTSFIIQNPTKAGSYINDFGGHGNNLGYYSDGSQIDVTFVPTAATLVPITVDEQEGYWGTFYSSSNVALPTGVSAYRVTDIDDGTQKLTLTAVEGSVLKGGEGYIVYSSSREPGIVMESTSTAPASFTGTNYLKGSDSEQEFAGEGSYYILSRKEVTEGVYNYGFFWQNGTGGNSVINAAHKAFLLVPSSAPAKSYNLSFNATNINNVENSADDINEPRFNLSGQRVGKNYKGIIIINGKKQIQK